MRNVADIKGANPLPFAGCVNLAEIHFALANAAAIRATQAYRDDHTLETGVEGVCRFDL